MHMYAYMVYVCMCIYMCFLSLIVGSRGLRVSLGSPPSCRRFWLPDLRLSSCGLSAVGSLPFELISDLSTRAAVAFAIAKVPLGLTPVRPNFRRFFNIFTSIFIVFAPNSIAFAQCCVFRSYLLQFY